MPINLISLLLLSNIIFHLEFTLPFSSKQAFRYLTGTQTAQHNNQTGIERQKP